MKVLLINNCHWPRGGAETVYFNTAQLLRENGHEVVFLSFTDDKNIQTGEKEYFVKRSGVIKKLTSYISNGEAARIIEEVVEKEKPDIAHAHLLWGGITASIIPVLHKHEIPIVHTAHDYRMVCPAYTFRNGCGEVCEKCKGGKFMECFKGRCSKGSVVQSALMTVEMYYRNKKWHPAKELDGIIYVSKFAKYKHEELDPLFARTMNTVLYNFTKVGEDYPSVEKDGGYYLYYGRLSHEKGIATLVEAFSGHPELKLKVVGTGPKEDELRQKNYPNVEFLGYKTGEELYNIVRNAQFVCVPSEWYENNPMTVVEAYSMGVPVIGARIGGIPEIVDEGKTGFLFESGNVESLEKAVEQSLAVGAEEYGAMKKNALAFAKEHFDRLTYADKLVKFYKEIIENNDIKTKNQL